MKLVKMSLVAALLVGSSAFAVENVKVSGDAKLFYATDDNHGNGDLFNKADSMAQFGLGLGITADLSDKVMAGAHYSVLSTLGVEGQLVNDVFEDTNNVTDYSWFDEAWLATTAGKTTFKAGRMQLDTPIVFSETWSAAVNTFEAAVAINTDLPDTTVVAAYVGGSNGGDVVTNPGVVIAPVNANGTSNFSQFYNGAYTVGIVNNSVEALTAQLWYYNATSVLDAYWLQADADLGGLLLGVQYTSQDASAFNDTFEAQTAMAVKVGYSNHKNLHAYIAYSSVDDAAGLENVGANLSGSGQSKLYTEAWWTYGYVSKSDTTAITFEIEYEADGIADFGFFYTMADGPETPANADAGDMTEITLTASRSYGGLDTTLAILNETKDGADATMGVQAYFTYNF